MDLVLQLLATGLVVGSLYALCALGWGLIYGTTLHFHVAHGAVFALAAYYAYVGQKLLHLPLILAVAAAVLAAATTGLLIDLLLYQQLERRGAFRTSIFISSLGLLIVLENVLAIVFTPDPMRMDIGALNTAVIIGPVFLTYLHIVTVVLAVAGYVALMAFLKWSRWGQAIRAVSSSPEMARTVGVNLARVHLLTYAIGSATNRLSYIYANRVMAGDLGFSETANPAGLPAHTFTVGDMVVLKVSSTGVACTQHADSGTCTVPVDLGTALGAHNYGASALYFNTTGGVGVGVTVGVGVGLTPSSKNQDMLVSSVLK